MTGDDRGKVLLGLMGGLFLAAMDATILAIAMPAVAADLDGDALYAWGFTTYMLAAAVSMPVLGALSDRHGRKRFFLWTLGLFVVGSVLCGLAPTMPFFLTARVVQGFGAGGMLSIPFAIAGALFHGHERGRALGRLASVWGLASIAGPVVGGALVQWVSWHWVFYINIPVGIVGGWLVLRHQEENAPAHAGRVDLWGALLLMLGVSGLLLALEETVPAQPAWALAGAALLGGFVLRERGAEHPILPLDLLGRRRILSANMAAALASLAIFVPIAFVPRFVDATYGSGSSLWAVFPLSIGWSGAATIVGRYLKNETRVRLAALAGLALLGAAMALAPLGMAQGLVGVGAVSFAMGAGMGIGTPALLLAVQNSVETARMGVATASQTFLRNIGGAVGIVALGAFLVPGMEGTLAGIAPALRAAAAVAGVGLVVVAVGLVATAPPAPQAKPPASRD